MKDFKSHSIVRCLLAALLMLPFFSSCYQYDEDDVLPKEGVVNYINLTVSVRTGQSAVTRGKPNGGEDGDGREKGIVTRETEVEGVTLIFYQTSNEGGINVLPQVAQGIPIDYAVYYETSLDDSYTPTTGTHPDEVFYTTGEQRLPTRLMVDKTYHVIVVANANLTNEIVLGDASRTSLATVRDMVLSTVYDGTGKATDARKFVMSSEKDAVMNISSTNSTYDKTTNRRTFRFDNIHIERMAARIDFWAKGATAYSDGSGSGENYNHPGYVYAAAGGSNDRFVLTSVMPFNLNNGDEYIIKRIAGASLQYLADETFENWVLDPYTTTKINDTPTYSQGNPLTSFAASSTAATTFPSDFIVTMAGQQANKLTVDASDDIVVWYPKENTVDQNTKYYYYATGIAFEGYYYKGGAKTGGQRRVYYHFIRHQGEQDAAYQALTPETLEAEMTKTIGSTGTAMNLGIVRNNIYRISIDGITADETPQLQLRIVVKKWDKFEHEPIYM